MAVKPLAGIGVLVTRPVHQGQRLGGLIESCGGTAIYLPALEIQPLAELPGSRAAKGPVDGFQLVIFVSVNAVIHGAVSLLGTRRDLRLAAIGRATAQALEALGFPVGVVPDGGFDSEALLRTPALAQVKGQRILIVRGEGGREVLGTELTARGAAVTYAEVYRRLPARPEPAQLQALEELWRHGGIHAYTATSSELLDALVGIVTPRIRELMDSTALLTGAPRVAEAAGRLGLGSPVIMARRPTDEALVEALHTWIEARHRPPSDA
ncbi:MAG: uroporphyrinogen-III synthase [Steroidobacteraceae bacterium]